MPSRPQTPRDRADPLERIVRLVIVPTSRSARGARDDGRPAHSRPPIQPTTS
jgi:hypothetical protein